MPDSLPVHVNRQELHGLDVPTEFEVADDFDVRLINHGEALHVHLHIDDALSEVASLEATNHYVKANSERRVRVNVADDGPRPVRGSLKVVTAYGAVTRYIDVSIDEPEESDEPVEVDERLSKPQPRETNDAGLLAGTPEPAPVLALGGVALVVAILAVMVFNSVFLMLGSLAVVAAVLVGLFVLSIER